MPRDLDLSRGVACKGVERMADRALRVKCSDCALLAKETLSLRLSTLSLRLSLVEEHSFSLDERRAAGHESWTFLLCDENLDSHEI